MSAYTQSPGVIWTPAKDTSTSRIPGSRFELFTRVYDPPPLFDFCFRDYLARVYDFGFGVWKLTLRV
jgi:hypothetical protein